MGPDEARKLFELDAEIYREAFIHFRNEAALLHRWVFASCFALNAGGVIAALNRTPTDIESAFLFTLGIIGSFFMIMRMATQMNALSRHSLDAYRYLRRSASRLEEVGGSTDAKISEPPTQMLIDNINSFDNPSRAAIWCSILAFGGGVAVWII
ncbi:MAG: hypothetical protein ABIT10_00760 [Alteraurantiacibacter sp.]